MEKLKLLDLFCGSGGAAMGYHKAGFDVVGVDINPQKHYPFEFHQADAMTYPLDGFDVIHASCPCQLWARGGNPNRSSYPDLISKTRERLIATGLPYIIENVPQAPLINPITICGGGLGIKLGDWQIHRHRNFECNFPVKGVECKKIAPITLSVTGMGTPTMSYRKIGRAVKVSEFRELMEMPWSGRHGISEAVHPRYTEYIGKQLMNWLLFDGIMRREPDYEELPL